MKEVNGVTVIEPDDCVQVIKGKDIGCIGIVLSEQNGELLLWSRTSVSVPGGAVSATFKAKVYEVMHIGKGRIRPKSRGEEQNQQAVQPAPESPRPKDRSVPKPQSQPPAQSESDGQPHRVRIPDGPKTSQFGGVDSDSLDLRPRPRTGEDIDPELLKPVFVPGPSAREIHGKPSNPDALRINNEQPARIEAEQTQAPTQREEAPQVQHKRRGPKVGRKRKQARSSLGIPVENQSRVPGEDGDQVRVDSGSKAQGGLPDKLPIG